MSRLDDAVNRWRRIQSWLKAQPKMIGIVARPKPIRPTKPMIRQKRSR